MENPVTSKLNNHQFINVETTRKNGQVVNTPVWFVAEGSLIYIRTGSKSGKVKRIRNNPGVKFATCKADGKLTGDWMDGTAEIVSDTVEKDSINRKFTRKYGLQKRLYDLVGFFSKMEMAALVIRY